jgi:hypothetical protein
MEYEMSQSDAMAFGAAYLIFMLVLGLAFHLFLGYCYKLIAEKTGHTDSAGLWWIPIINLLIPLKVAGKPSWWLLLLLIPFVNFVVLIIVYMAVAEARGKENWWGIIATFIPIVGLPYLAFTDSPATNPAV